MMDISIEFINEFAITQKMKSELADLLATTFPESKYYGRHYYKQLSHARLVINIGGVTIGQVGLDYRAMNLNGNLVHVLGIIGLAIDADHRDKGLGTQLMNRVEEIATENKNNIDFLFLVTDIPSFYEKLGYQKTIQKVSWMKIYENRNRGMGNEQVDDCFLMYKSVSGKPWEDGEMDMLGYWY